MHFSIPETEECSAADGSSYTGYHLRINGLHHCTLRYRQFRHLHQQLQNLYSSSTLPEFPPRKFFPLTPVQAEDRRAQLERYIQLVAQDPRISSGVFLQAFLRLAQTETHLNQLENDVILLQIMLPGEEFIAVNATTSDQTETVLKLVSQQINLKEELHPYFGLFVYETDSCHKCVLSRKLLSYESPYLAVKLTGDKGNLVFRKTYWDPSYDEDLMRDPVGLKLVYNQMLDDIKRNWIAPDSKQKTMLKRLIAERKEEECVRVGQGIRFYGGIFLPECKIDYPSQGSCGSIHINSKELTFLYQDNSEMIFRVTRIRSWRMTTLLDGKGCGEVKSSSPKLELSFEYLLSKDRLQWIAVKSEQLLLLSLCLQSLVEELVQKQSGQRKSMTSQGKLLDEILSEMTYMRQDGSLQTLGDISAVSNKKQLRKPRSSMLVRFRSGLSQDRGEAFVENYAFTDVRDEDL